jgi:4,5-DOPA dioxygenase extradiol
MPSERYGGIFVSHGAPTLPLDEHPARDFLRDLGRRLERPRAIVALSPHWLTPELSIKSPAQFETWHDFQGFPEALYRLQYRPPGAAAVRDRAVKLLRAADIAIEPASADRRLDHGVWVPLILMYPRADVPVVQISATWDAPRQYRDIGRALRPLTDEGVLLLGTGGAVHNLHELEYDDASEPPAWAREFDEWLAQRLAAGEWDALMDYRREAPAAERAHPTDDHFLPLFFAGGAGERVTPLHRSFSYGSLSMAAYGFR